MRYLHDRVLVRHGPHRDWNYTILPAPRPAPEPEPAPQPAGRVPQEALNHPALTGMQPQDISALAAALEVPFGAHREQSGYSRRGRRRVTAIKNQDGSNGHRRIDLTDHVLAWRLRGHLHLPVTITGALLGVDSTTVSHAATLTASCWPPPASRCQPPPSHPAPACAPPMTCATTQQQPESTSPSRKPGRRCRNTPGGSGSNPRHARKH